MKRGFFLATVMLFISSCATTSTLPTLQRVGNTIIDPEYKYQLEIPVGWNYYDKAYVDKMDATQSKQIADAIVSRKDKSARALVLEPREKAVITIFASRTRNYNTKQQILNDYINRMKKHIKITNKDRKYEYMKNLNINQFKKILDLNLYFEAGQYRCLMYYKISIRNNIMYSIILTYCTVSFDFDDYLRQFYKCVESLCFTNMEAESKKVRRNITDRLEELRELKNRGLITEEDYKEKRKKILDEL